MMQESAVEIPLLTFNSLYNLLREEKRIKILQELPELFYDAQNKFLDDKKKLILKFKENSDLKNMQKEKLILKNSQKISKEILNLRCIKIANIAIKNELFGEEILSTQNILEKEKDFLESIKVSVKKLKWI